MAKRHELYATYLLAYAREDADPSAHFAITMASALGVLHAKKKYGESTMDGLLLLLEDVGILPDDDELDGDAEDGDARQLAEAQARLAKLIKGGGAVDPGGGSLLAAASHEIERLRGNLERSERSDRDGWTLKAKMERELERAQGELQQAKEALSHVRAKVIDLQTDADRQRVDLEQAHKTIQAMNAERDELYDALEIHSGETLTEAARRVAGGAAEMRELAAALAEKIKGAIQDVLAKAALQDAANGIRALPLSPEPPADPAIRKADTTRALIAIGVPAGRAEQAARIAEGEGGAAPETAHSAVLRMAKAGHLGRLKDDYDWLEFRRYIRGFMGAYIGKRGPDENTLVPGDHASAAWRSTSPGGLSAEDAETLRGAGWRRDADGIWTGSYGSVLCEARPVERATLRDLARTIRLQKAPAAAHGAPGKGSSAEATAAGSDSLTDERQGAQGGPIFPAKPWSIRTGQKWFQISTGHEYVVPENIDTTRARELMRSSDWALASDPDGYRNQAIDSLRENGAPSQSLPKPARVEAGQRWSLDARDMGGGLVEYRVAEVAGHQACLLGDGRTIYRGTAEILGSLRWRFLGAPPRSWGRCDGAGTPTDLDKIEAISARVKAASARGETRQQDGEDAPIDLGSVAELWSEAAGVRLAMPKDADPRAVLATVAELLGLPDPATELETTYQRGRAEGRSDERHNAGERDRDASARAFGSGLAEGERRAKAKAAELARAWEGYQGRRQAEEDSAVDDGRDAMAGRHSAAAAVWASAARNLKDAFGLPTDPGQPPTGRETTPEEGAEPKAHTEPKSTWDLDSVETSADHAQQKAKLDAATLARRWLTPRLNMLAHAEAEGPAPVGRSRSEGIAAVWRVAIEDLCMTFGIPEPQPDGPGAEMGAQLLKRDEDRRRRRHEAERDALCPGPSKVGGAYAEAMGAPRGCLCTWFTAGGNPSRSPFRGRVPGPLPCPVHPSPQAPTSDVGLDSAGDVEVSVWRPTFNEPHGSQRLVGVAGVPMSHGDAVATVGAILDAADACKMCDGSGEVNYANHEGPHDCPTCSAPPPDPLEPYRAKASAEQRAACLHPPDDRHPISGDGWLCGLCGADCARPEALAEELTAERLDALERSARLAHSSSDAADVAHRMLATNVLALASEVRRLRDDAGDDGDRRRLVELHGRVDAAMEHVVNALACVAQGRAEEAQRILTEARRALLGIKAAAPELERKGEAHIAAPAGVHDREQLGREVRLEWVAWAHEQPDPKASWLVPWDRLSAPDQEVDRRIGERLFNLGARHGRAEAFKAGLEHGERVTHIAWKTATGVASPAEAARLYEDQGARLHELESANPRSLAAMEAMTERHFQRGVEEGERRGRAAAQEAVDHARREGRVLRDELETERHLNEELRAQRAEGVTQEPKLSPAADADLVDRVASLLADVYDEPADGELRHGRTAREAIRMVREWRAVLAKPTVVALGQRWTCTGIEGVLVVLNIAEDGSQAFVATPQAANGFAARTADMLGLREWTFLSSPA